MRNKNVNTYVSERLFDIIETDWKKLGYPSKAAYLRRLLIEGTKHQYVFVNPEDMSLDPEPVQMNVQRVEGDVHPQPSYETDNSI